MSADKPVMNELMGHAYQDAVSLALASKVVELLRTSPSIIEHAKNNIARWKKINACTPSLLRCYEEWSAILEKPLEEVCSILLSPSEDSSRLRQSSPFAGVLPFSEVWLIKKEIKQNWCYAKRAA